MELTPEQWRRVLPLFETVLDKPPAQRSALLAAANEDPAVLEEVGRLLRSHSEAGNFLRTSGLPIPVVPHLPNEAQSFSSGDLLADRFRVIRFLARGGMGEVYEAQDVELREQVALKTIRSELLEDSHALERFKREVHLAKQVTHPNVCRIFDLFRHATSTNTSILLVSMELLRGETLAAYLARVGRMTWPEASPIALQMANGLGAAHEMGILHRDFKPGNVVLIEGAKGIRAVITDFGLALQPSNETTRTTRQTGTGHFGTPAYMSPEQVEGRSLTPASDVYSLGLVLYEMVTGTRPFDHPTPLAMAVRRVRETAASPRNLVPELDARGEQVIVRCLERAPTHRFATAQEVARAIQERGRPIARAHPRHVVTWSLCVLGVLLVGLGVIYHRFRHAKPLTEKDTIVLADFNNRTGDPVFEDTLRQALAIELGQSPFINVLSDRKISETLQMMGRPADEHITMDVGRELCLRTGGKALLGGTISSLGSHYLIALNAAACETGDTLAQEQGEAARKEDVLNTLSRASSSLRSKLGESLLPKFDAPLEDATTSSLDALKAYSLGVKTHRREGDSAALPFFQHAVELDPSFAMAHRFLSVIYEGLEESEKAAQSAATAFALREHVTERERLAIEGHYYLIATGELAKAEHAFELYAQTYPRDSRAHSELGFTRWLLGHYDKSLPEYREALRLDPDNVRNHANVAGALINMGRFAEAQEVLQQAQARKLDDELLWINLYSVAFARADSAEMHHLVENAAGRSGLDDVLLGMQSDTEAYFGRLKRSRELMTRAQQLARTNGDNETASGYLLNAALREVEAGYPDKVRRDVTHALTMSSGRSVRTLSAMALARMGDVGRAEIMAGDLQKQFPTDTLINNFWLPTIRAAIALKRGDAPRALELSEATSACDLAPNTYLLGPYLRGQAYLETRQGNEAVVEFQKMIDNPGVVDNFILGALAHVGLGRGYAMTGDTAKAKAAYQHFLNLWKNADPGIPILKQARTEYAKLQ